MKDHPSPHASHARRGPLKGGRSSTSPQLAVAVVLGALAACGTSAEEAAPAPSSSAASSTGPGAGELVVVLDRGEGGPPERWTLSCAEPPTGDLPDPAAACAHLQGLPDPFAALPGDQVCSQQYGGPQTAHVTGRWAGDDVDLALARTNGCQIAQWDSLGPLLPGPGG
jgi:subtilisin inhibitor-like